MKGSKTFDESQDLRKRIDETLTEEEFNQRENGPKEIVVTVSNLSLG